MAPALASSSIEPHVSRIRELSRSGDYRGALCEAEALARELPANREALYLIAANRRCLNQIPEALESLRKLELHHPRYSLLHQERGHCLVALRDASGAVESFTQAVNLNPALAASWSMLEILFRMTGDAKRAAAAGQQLFALKNLPAEIVRAGSLFSDGDLDAAESILRQSTGNCIEHVESLRLLARIAHRRGALDDAEELLGKVVQRAPGYVAAHLDYARVLLDAQDYSQAKESAGALLAREPANWDCRFLLAAACDGLGEHEYAIELYSRLIAEKPDSWEARMALGHALKSIGRIHEAIGCYKAALEARHGLGDAWWSLANLKNYRFSEEEVARMRAEEADPASQTVDQIHYCFALGKALEDSTNFAESWEFYQRGNALKRSEVRYDPHALVSMARELREVCTAQFFADRADSGAEDRDPIFVVGLPRSGSTLIEQILASHSKVEGTQELPIIPRIAKELSLELGKFDRGTGVDAHYSEALIGLTREDCRKLGRRYLDEARAYRAAKLFFVDKMPNNFCHIGLIHLILPNATIIDVRRAPMPCCFSNLKQLFASGQEFSYGIDEIALYYRIYLALMRHWDAVLAGRVLHVFYEDLVEDPESTVHRILEFCGLEFEPDCLEFYKTERSVRTPSSEQVRRPIFRHGLDQWRNYEPWLGPLKDALGDALVRYRE